MLVILTEVSLYHTKALERIIALICIIDSTIMPLISAIMTGSGTNSNTLALERICSRVILCPYGRPVGCFETRERLLAAFRDAIKGMSSLDRCE